MTTTRSVTIIYRSMRSARDGKPELGRSLNTLGVRPNKDLPVDAEGCVEPLTGGMSVTPERWEDIPPSLLPRALRGEGRHPLYFLTVERIPATLAVRVDKPKHANVEPARRCPFEAFEVEIHETRTMWEPYK